MHRLLSCELWADLTGSLRCPNIINYVSRDNGCLSILPRSSFYQLVSVTPRMNWLLCCVITQACKASKHAMFSFGAADMGGVWMGKKRHNLLCKASWLLGQEAWFKIGLNLLMRYAWYLESLFFVTIRAYCTWCYLLYVFEYLYVHWLVQGSVQSTVHRVKVYHVALAHDKYQNSISFPSFPPHFLSPQMALQAHGVGGRGRGMLLNKLGRGKL